MNQLSRTNFQSIVRSYREVSVPRLHGTVFIRDLTADEVANFAKMQTNQGLGPASAYLVRIGTIAANGDAMFTEDDDELIGQFPYAVTQPILDALLELNELKSKDEAKKERPAAN